MRWPCTFTSSGVPVFRSLLFLLAGLFLAACGERSPAPAATEGPPEPGPEVLERITRRPDQGAVHLVRLVQRADVYAFDPDRIAIRSGDVVRFVTSGGQPESIAFDADTAAPEAAAFIRAHDLHLGALLTVPGEAYDVAFVDAPPGDYPFLSRPHVGHGMRGVVTVAE